MTIKLYSLQSHSTRVVGMRRVYIFGSSSLNKILHWKERGVNKRYTNQISQHSVPKVKFKEKSNQKVSNVKNQKKQLAQGRVLCVFYLFRVAVHV